MYHSIDDSGSAISLSSQSFERHLEWFAKSRIEVVSLEEISSVEDQRDAVALTFDDAFQNFEKEALPRLSDRGFPSTVFVVTEQAGKSNAWGGAKQRGIPDLPLLGWDALGRIQECGVTLGAHSKTHRSLPGLSATQLEDEILGSQERLAQATGSRPRTFAYPYGDWNRTCADVVGANFDAACTTELRVLRDSDHRTLLPRLDAYYFGSSGTIEAWGSAAFRARIKFRAGLRNVKALFRGRS